MTLPRTPPVHTMAGALACRGSGSPLPRLTGETHASTLAAPAGSGQDEVRCQRLLGSIATMPELGDPTTAPPSAWRSVTLMSSRPSVTVSSRTFTGT